MSKTKIIFAVVFLFLQTAAPETVFGASSRWIDVSGNNKKNGLVSDQKGMETNIAVSPGGEIFVAFQDRRERVFVRKFDGQKWRGIPGNSNTAYVARNGDKPTLAVDKTGNLYLAYKDLDAKKRARVRKWDGSAWSDLSDEYNPSGYISEKGGFEPVLCFDKSGENLYAAFRDEAGGERIKVKKWKKTGWETAADESNPDGLISNSVASEVDLKASKVNDDIFAAFEDRASGNRIRVKKWDGAVWQNLSDASHPDGFVSAVAGFSPSIETDFEGNLYLTYTGRDNKNTYVHKWDGSAWEDIAGGVAIHGRTIESILTIDNRNLVYLAYSVKKRGNWRVRMNVWNGSVWLGAPDRENQNVSRGKGKGDPSLAVLENKVYMSFTDAKNRNRARVKMLDFEP